MANIQPRRDKSGNIISYQIRIHRGRDVNGKQLSPYTTTLLPPLNKNGKALEGKSLEKALNKAAFDFEEKCKNNIATSNIKLAEYCPQYLAIIKNSLSPTTQQFYKSQIDRHIIPMLGHMRLKDIKTSHIQEYINRLQELPLTKRNGEPDGDNKISAATVQRYLSVLKSILSQAAKSDIIPTSPARAEKLTMQTVTKPKIEIFTKQQAAEMIACLVKESLQFQVMVQLAIIMGARRGELVGLKFSDVDYSNCKITIERAAIKLRKTPTQIKAPKDYEVRDITVSPYCIQLIEMLREEKIREAARLGTAWNDGNWLFTKWNGEIMNPQTPTKQWRKFLKRHGLPHKKLHALRHTSATLLLYAGLNVKQVQSRLGHGDIETTNKYLHVIEEADREAANILDNMLNPPKPNGKPINLFKKAE